MKLCQTTLKSNNFEEFKLKKDYGIQKIAHAGYAKGSYQGYFYITCLLTFMQNILPIIRHIFPLFLSQF